MSHKYRLHFLNYPIGYNKQTMKHTMKKFIKITTRNEGGSIVRAWIDADKIVQLSQDSVTQAGDNEGTCIFNDGTVIPVITFNETIDSLN